MIMSFKSLLLLSTALACGTLLAGCDEPKAGGKAKVTIDGKVFNLEIAAEDQTRFHGLSDRTKIDPDGGMLFVFKEARELEFVMRDCPIPIDIIFVDGTGRVTSFHKMTPEAPRTDEEKQGTPPYKDAPKWTWTNPKYEARLKRYPSKFAAQYVIELAGNTLDTLKIKQNDKIEFDRAAMKKLAK